MKVLYKILYSIAVFSVLFPMPTAHAQTQSIEDCILNGLKGVNSDAAARMVREACKEKISKEKNSQIVKKYGILKFEEIETQGWETTGTNNIRLYITNTTDQTVTTVAVTATEVTSNYCNFYDKSKAITYFYRFTLKPNSKGVIDAPISTFLKEDRLCVTVETVLRRPEKISDTRLFQQSGAEISLAEIKTLEQQLRTKFNYNLAPAK